LTTIAMFATLAIILSYIESFIPITTVYGFKLGLANLIIVLCLYIMGVVPALIINVVRIFVVGFLFGNLFSIVYSLAGAFVSILVMVIIKNTKLFHIHTVSVAGGVSHNVAQLVVAGIVMKTTNIYVLFPMLIVSGVITGVLIGIIASAVYHRFWKLYSNLDN